ncbi:ABC transporter ATP-binding protein (plasmid) [Azospirillum argentinense]|uniref:ABC transporter ATP-binding protein n=1 Tax=Azospirillum argentinense TaxID=2970906 RepID=A0A4D8PWT4_9PROT|nr:ABC transporter ATP-binding protein [Azospirillum argentinense]QCO00359.1 ABC transporter ATP-binding protein [Azospirillum argentinense]
MPSDIAISVKGLGKAYTIYKKPEDRIKQMLWRNRRKFYDEYWALQGVDVEIRRGETVGIIGRNGSGKSTFLQMVCGTLNPTHGEVTVNGRIAALLELGAGFNPEFTGRENVYLAASVLGLDHDRIDERYAAIEAFAGIGDFINQPVKLYSSGMYARLAFAVAAHVDADILIVDEILAVGDAAFTQKCMRFIREFKEHGTLLFVSHDAASIINLCDRAVWIDRGFLRETGPAKEVCHSYLAALYSEKDDSSFRIGGSRRPPDGPVRAKPDARHDFLKESTLRNEIELFDFDPDAPWFGSRGATIEGVRLQDPAGATLDVLYGGEEVILRVDAMAHTNIDRPIVGFVVKDRLGQTLFGDNTYISFRETPVTVQTGQSFSASFQFQFPYLPAGDYAMSVAIAAGSREDHVQHHWIDEALFLKVVSSHVSRGLVGLPMHAIDLVVHQPDHQSGFAKNA